MFFCIFSLWSLVNEFGLYTGLNSISSVKSEKMNKIKPLLIYNRVYITYKKWCCFIHLDMFWLWNSNKDHKNGLKGQELTFMNFLHVFYGSPHRSLASHDGQMAWAFFQPRYNSGYLWLVNLKRFWIGFQGWCPVQGWEFVQLSNFC